MKNALIIALFLTFNNLYSHYSYANELNISYNKNDIFNIKQLSLNVYENYKKEDLFKLSLKIESIPEKLNIRYYLSRKYPESPEGYFSRAWLADYDNKETIRDKYYEECMKKYPQFIPSLYNYLNTYKTKENVQEIINKLENALTVNPSYSDYSLVGMGYFFYKNNLENQELAEQFLNRWKKKLGSDLYIFDYIYGLEASNSKKNYLFLSAMKKRGGTENFQIWKDLINLRINNEPNNKSSTKKLKILKPLIEYLNHMSQKKNKTLDNKIFMLNSYQLIADKFLQFDDFEQAYTFYKKSLDIIPTIDVMLKMYEVLNSSNRKKDALKVLQNSLKIFPDRQELLSYIGQISKNNNLNFNSETYYLLAIKNSLTNKDKWKNIKDYTNNISNDYNKSEKIILNLLNESSFTKTEVYKQLYEYSLDSEKLEKAIYYLKNLNENNSNENYLNEIYFEQEENKLNNLLIYKRDFKKLISKDPFIFNKSLNTDFLNISPDKNFFVTGYQPLQITEMKNYLQLKDYSLPDGLYYDSVRKISPNGKFIIVNLGSFSKIKPVALIDLEKDNLENIIFFNETPSNIVWSPDSSEVVFRFESGNLGKYNIQKRKKTQMNLEQNFDSHGQMVWAKNGKYIAGIEKFSNGKLKIFDAKTLKLVKVFANVDWPHSLAQTDNGDFLICADNKRTLHVWNLKNWSYKMMKIPSLVSQISSHPTENKIIVNDWGGGENNTTALIDVEKMKIITEKDTLLKTPDYYFTKSGKEVIEIENREDFNLLNAKI